MAKDINQCNFIGRLGKDPATRTFDNGNKVTNFTIACGDDYKGKNGQKIEQTNWIKITANGKLAEIAAQYLKKGSRVFISGKLVERKWQDQNGQDRYTTEIRADQMQMLDSRGDNQGQFASPRATPQQNYSAPANAGFDDDFDNDIPF